MNRCGQLKRADAEYGKALGMLVKANCFLYLCGQMVEG